MSILVDFNQIMIATYMSQVGNHANMKIDENLFRHMAVNTIRANKMKFHQYGEMILCSDNTNFWRKDIFPYYKAHRQKDREKSDVDWNDLFRLLNMVRDEFKEYLPYKVLHIPRAEADDIIGSIVYKKGSQLNAGENILILSGDKDFKQLQMFGNVSQYDPVRKRWIKENDPHNYLYEHIIKGDKGDGIPNVLMPDDAFITNQRQKPITKKRLELFQDINNMDDEVKRNYERNRHLICLCKIREDIKTAILEEYEKENTKDRSRLLEYFHDYKLKNLVESINDF